MPKRGRRGYPTAILIGLDQNTANVWLVFSESIKQGKMLTREGSDEKASYRHAEDIVEAVRALIPEGFNQLILASPERTRHASELFEHINRRHGWLIKRLTVKALQGKAVTATDVVQLVKTNRIQESVEEAAGETNERIMDRLEKALNGGHVLFTVQELGDAMHAERNPEFILITEKFDAANRGSRRYQSLIQRAKNMRATVTILRPDAPASPRLEQLGGFVCVIHQ
jgi:stalled ribosome rescue protein Dom34